MCNNQDSSLSWPPSQAEQSGEKGLGKRGEPESNGYSGSAAEILCGDGRNFQKDNHHCNTLGFMAKGPNGSLSSVLDTWKPIWSLQKKEKKRTLRLWETRFSGLMKSILNCLVSILSGMSGGNQAPLITCPIPSQQWSMVLAASCCGGVFQGFGDWSGLSESWTQK